MKLKEYLRIGILILVFITLISITYSLVYGPVQCGTLFCYSFSIDGIGTLTNDFQPIHTIKVASAIRYEPDLTLTYIQKGTIRRVENTDFQLSRTLVGNEETWAFNFANSLKRLDTGSYTFYTTFYNPNSLSDTITYTYTYLIDITPPTVDTVRLFQNSTEKTDFMIGENNNVSFQVTVKDLDGESSDAVPETQVVSVELSLDESTTKIPLVKQTDDAYFVNLGILSLGLHNVRFDAYDNLTNLNDTVTYSFSVNDITGPGIEVLSPKTGVTSDVQPIIKIRTTETSTCKLYDYNYPDTLLGNFIAESNNVYRVTSPTLVEGQTRSFNVSCKDASNNPSSIKLDILKDNVVPLLTSLTSTRGTNIAMRDANSQITSLDVVTSKETICRRIGYHYNYGVSHTPVYEDMIPFDNINYAGNPLQDITNDIDGLLDDNQGNNFRFYVRCEAKSGLKTTTLDYIDINVTVGSLLAVTKSPIGVINNKDPYLSLETNIACDCQYQDQQGADWQLLGEHSTYLHTSSQKQLTQDGTYNYPVRCYTGAYYEDPAEGTARFDTIISFVLDTKTVKPVITSVKDVNNVQVMNSKTKENEFIVNGTAERNSTVNVIVKDSSGALIFTALVDTTQDDEFFAEIYLGGYDSNYSIYANVTDIVGNKNISGAVYVIRDTTGPIQPIMWGLPKATNNPNITLTGYINETGNIEISVISNEDLFGHYVIPTTIENSAFLTNINLMDTSTSKSTYSIGSDFIWITDNDFSKITNNNFVEFSNHDLNYYGRYDITSVQDIDWPFNTKVYITPNLINEVPTGSYMRVYTTRYPSGWFNKSVELSEGLNDIYIRGIDSLIQLGIPKIISIIKDTTSPNINPGFSGIVSDNKTIVSAGIADSLSGIDNDSIRMNIIGPINCTDLKATEDIALTRQEDKVSFDITSVSGYCTNGADEYPNGNYTVNLTVADMAGNINNTQWKFEVNTNVAGISTFAVDSGVERGGKWYSKNVNSINVLFNSEVQVTDRKLHNKDTGAEIALTSVPMEGNLFVYNPASMPDGNYSFNITAEKKMGGVFLNPTTFIREIIIDNKAPFVVHSSFSSALDTHSYSQNLTVEIQVSDNTFVNESDIRLMLLHGTSPYEGGDILFSPVSGNLYRAKINSSLFEFLGLGEYTLKYSAKDILGNINDSVTKDITVIDDVDPLVEDNFPTGTMKNKSFNIKSIISEYSDLQSVQLVINGNSIPMANSKQVDYDGGYFYKNETEVPTFPNNHVILEVMDVHNNHLSFSWDFTIYSRMTQVDKIYLGSESVGTQIGSYTNLDIDQYTLCADFTTDVSLTSSFGLNISGQARLITQKLGLGKKCYNLNLHNKLIEGSYVITLNSDKGEIFYIRFIVDRTKPIVIVDPIAVTKESTAVINGTVQDDNPFTVMVDLDDVNMNGNRFDKTVNLNEGDNIFTITTTDAAGNQNTTTIAIVKDSSGPDVLEVNAISSPTNNNLAIISGVTEADGKVVVYSEVDTLLTEAQASQQEIFYDCTSLSQKVSNTQLRFNVIPGYRELDYLRGIFAANRYVSVLDVMPRYKISYIGVAEDYITVNLQSPILEDIAPTTNICVYSTPLPSGTFATESLDLIEGNNLFKLHPYDKWNNHGDGAIREVNVYLDTTPPSITPEQPIGTISENKTIIKALIDGTGSGINQSSAAINVRGPCNINNIAGDELGWSDNEVTFDIGAIPKCNPEGEYLSGSYNITLNVSDEVGNKNSIKWNFTIDTNVPSRPTFTIPLAKEQGDKLYTTDKIPIVTIAYSSNEKISITQSLLDGIDVILTPDANGYTFTYQPITLTEAQHTIEISASKEISPGVYGGSNKYSKGIVVDSTPPSIEIGHTLSSQYSYTQNITLSIQPSDNSPINETDAKINLIKTGAWGKYINLTKQATGKYETNLSNLGIGEYFITYYIKDILNNLNDSIQESFNVIDDKAPEIKYNKPTGILKNKSIIITSSLEDISIIDSISLDINGYSVTPLRDGNNISYNPPAYMLNNESGATIEPDNNEVTIIANDSFNNIAELEWRFTIYSRVSQIDTITLSTQQQQEAVTINNGGFTNIGSDKYLMCVDFTTPPAITQASLTLNSISGRTIAELSALRTETRYCYILNNANLEPGTYSITLSSTDQTYNINFIVDRKSPGIYIDSSVVSRTRNTNVNITGTFVENNLDYIDVDGNLAQLDGNNYSYEISLTGTRTITVTAYDKAGNSNSTSMTIELDQEGPISLTIDDIPSPTSQQSTTIEGVTEASARVELYRDISTPLGTAIANPRETDYGADTLSSNSAQGSLILYFIGTVSTTIFQQGRFIQIGDSKNRIGISGLIQANANTVKVTLASTLPRDVPKDTVLIKVYNTSSPEGRFSFSSVVLIEGANDFEVYVYDDIGNLGASATQDVIVTLDTTPPSITPEQPIGTISENKTIIKALIDGTGSGINQSSVVINVKGPCNINSITNDEVTWDNNEVTFDINGRTSCNGKDEYADGSYNITLNVSDAVGNKNSIKWNFTIDTNVPLQPVFIVNGITVLSGEHYMAETRGIVKIQFPDPDVDITQFKFNDVEKTRDVLGGYFKESLNHYNYTADSLTDGTYTISITAAKKIGLIYGAENNYVFDLIVDTVNPIVGLTAPAYTNINEVSLDMSYTDDNIKGINLTGDLEDAPLTVDLNTLTGYKINLSGSNGSKTITATAYDNAGNSKANTTIIILDSAKPIVSVNITNAFKAGDNFYTSLDVVEVECLCNDSVIGIDISGCSDSNVEMYYRSIDELNWNAASASFTLPVGADEDKTFELMCKMRDNSGNIGNGTSLLRVDRSYPSITVLTPLNNRTSTAANTVRIMTSDPCACNFSWLSDFREGYVWEFASADNIIHTYPFDLSGVPGWDEEDKIYYVKCNNIFGKSSVISVPLIIDTLPLNITGAVSGKGDYYSDDPSNTILVMTNKDSVCYYTDSYDSKTYNITTQYTKLHTQTRDFSSGVHKLLVDCTDLSGGHAFEARWINFTSSATEVLRIIDSGPNGRIADNTPGLWVKINKDANCTFNSTPSSGSYSYVDGGLVYIKYKNITASLEEGNHSYIVRCVFATIETDFSNILFNVNTTPPLPPIVDLPLDNQIVKNNLFINGTTENDVDKVIILLDGAEVAVLNVVDGKFSGTIDMSARNDATYNLEASAQFPGGDQHRSDPTTRTVVKDTLSQIPILNELSVSVGLNHVEVNGTAEPNSQVMIYWSSVSGADGIELDNILSNGLGFFEADITLLEKENFIYSKSIDAYDNPTSQKSNEITTYYDIEPPLITSILPNTNQNLAPIEIRAHIEDNSSIVNVTLTLNDTPIYYYSFPQNKLPTKSLPGIIDSYTPTDNGTYMINITAKDEFGNTNSSYGQFLFDTDIPSSPLFNLDGVLTNYSSPKLVFIYDKEVAIDSLNISATPITTSDNKEFNYTTTDIDDGLHNIEIAAHKLNGNGAVGKYSFDFIIDTILPTVTISSSVPSTTTVAPVTITGTCGDNLAPEDQIEMNIVQGTYTFVTHCVSGHYSKEIRLSDENGDKTVVVVAKDWANNTNSATKVIKLDTGIPEVNITNIINNGDILFGQMPYKTNKDLVTIIGNYSDDNFDDIFVMINNQIQSSPQLYLDRAAKEFELNISLSGSIGAETPYDIMIFANDTFGQKGNASVLITYDIAGPKITAFAPSTNVTNETQPTISITTNEYATGCVINYSLHTTTGYQVDSFETEDNLYFTKKLSTLIKHIGGGTYSQDVYLSCTDSLGNEATYAWPLTVDLSNPNITGYDIDYYARVLIGYTDDSKEFLITQPKPLGLAKMRLTALTNEDTLCTYDYLGNTNNFENYYDYSMSSRTPEIILDDLTNYEYTIICTDKSGRKSAAKEISLQVNTQLVTEKPVINHLYPKDGIKVGNRTILFNGTILSLTPGVDIIDSWFKIDDQDYPIILADGIYYNTSIALTQDKEYNFTLFAENSEGLMSNYSSWFIIDTTPPTPPVIIADENLD